MSLSYADLKRTLKLAIHIRKAKKIRVLSEILLTFFFLFTAVKIIRLSNAGKFCIFKNMAPYIINFGRGLCSSFLCFFVFYAKL